VRISDRGEEEYFFAEDDRPRLPVKVEAFVSAAGLSQGNRRRFCSAHDCGRQTGILRRSSSVGNDEKNPPISRRVFSQDRRFSRITL